MSTVFNAAITAEQLEKMSEPGVRFELVEGEIRRMTPAGFEHGTIASRLLSMLENYVRQHDLGKTCAAETGFLLTRDPDTVRAPDAAFVSHERIKEIPADSGSYAPIAPDLVAEVVSPNDTFAQVEEKAQFWLRCGTRMVLVVEPSNRALRVYQSEQVSFLQESDTFSAGDVVPGWQFEVAELFQ
jgi:Uma2 family endonuclease